MSLQRKKLLLAGTLVLLSLAISQVWRPLLDRALNEDNAEDTNGEVIFVSEDTDDFSPGPAVGSHFPGLRALNGTTPVSLLQPLAGKRGTLLAIVRSVQYSPHCRSQILELQRHQAEFEAAGLAVVILSPDPPEILQTLAQENAISLPLLSDIHSLSVTTLGVLDTQKSNSETEARPYPGVLLIGPNHRVAGKLFLRKTNQRIDAAALLTYANSILP